MQVDFHDQGLLVAWTDPASSSYTDIPLDDSAQDLLAPESPSHSPSQLHHHRHQQHHHPHHINQQRQHIPDHKLVTSPSVTYESQSHAPYTTLAEAEALAHFEYANSVVPSLISQSASEMRTGPGGGGRVEGAGGGRRVWKRKREEEKNGDVSNQNKMDASQRCDVCGEQASGHYFGALVCLPCKSFFIRCTKDGRPSFSSQCGGKCDVLKGGRVRCQHCRFQKCVSAGMFRKEKPEAVEPAEGQLLCKVCGDIANGVHFGVTTCEGCKKFFRRGLKENRTYTCKGSMRCSINPRMRNNCRYCRYQKCITEGMSREAIKMGRPKKGELTYRKPLKSNRMKPVLKGSYNKQLSESNRSSMSSEYDQDDVSASDDVFDPMSAAQHQQLHPNHQQLQQPHQQQQPQQPGTFSLGSILHDCMTVQDWDQKVEMSGLGQTVHRVPSHSAGGGSITEEGKISPHMRHSSPTLLAQMLSRQQQEQQQHLLEHHHLQLQHVKVMDPLQSGLQQRHQVVAYQVHNPNSTSSLEPLTDLEYSGEHNLPVNRAIKVEDVSLHDGPDGQFTEGVVLEDMRNLEAVSKSDFQTYQLQNLDPNTAYSVSNQQAATSSLGDGTTLVSISHLNPDVNSQIVAINMSSQSVQYTPHNHQDPIIIRNFNHPQQIISVTQNQFLQQGNMDQRPSHDDPNLEQEEGIKMNDVLSSSRSHQIVTSQGVIRTAHHPHSITSNLQVHNISEVSRNVFSHINSSMHQPFSSDIANVSSLDGSPHLSPDSLRPRRLHGTVEEANFTVLSPSGQHTITSFPVSFTSSSQNAISAQHKISGIKSPIAAILQQHRNAIQEGRPIQLSSDEIEELLNTVNAEQQLSQRHLNEQNLSKDQGEESDQNNIDIRSQNSDIRSQNNIDIRSQNNIDIRRQSVGGYMVDTELQLDELHHYSRQTAPNYHSISTSSHYQSNSPITHSTTQTHRKLYQNQISPGSNSSSNERRELNMVYNNNNNNIQVTYISPQHVHTSPNNQTAENNEIYDDSFNSSLIRDSTLLHEINRIFLAIDNSCDTYDCGRQISDDSNNRIDDRIIVSLMSPDEFSPEISHKYWHGFQPPERFVAMNAETQKIIHDVLDAFDSLQKTYMTNEPEYVNRKMSKDQLEHWHHIQRRIARHVVAGQRFCRNIPGYFKLDIQDRISLGKHVGFGLMVLIACTEFYDSEFKRFKHIWNWTMPTQNPLFSYKIHLLTLGDKIHDIQLDRTEASMMCAISMTSIDCPGLLKPEIVCVVRDALIDALQAHILTKTESPQRLKKLLSIMPQVRLMTVWYNNLMKKMSLPSEVINNKISKARLAEAVGTENTPNFS